MSVLEIVLYSVIGLAVLIYVIKNIKTWRKPKKKEQQDNKGNIIDADEDD